MGGISRCCRKRVLVSAPKKIKPGQKAFSFVRLPGWFTLFQIIYFKIDNHITDADIAKYLLKVFLCSFYSSTHLQLIFFYLHSTDKPKADTMLLGETWLQIWSNLCVLEFLFVYRSSAGKSLKRVSVFEREALPGLYRQTCKWASVLKRS